MWVMPEGVYPRASAARRKLPASTALRKTLIFCVSMVRHPVHLFCHISFVRVSHNTSMEYRFIFVKTFCMIGTSEHKRPKGTQRHLERDGM